MKAVDSATLMINPGLPRLFLLSKIPADAEPLTGFRRFFHESVLTLKLGIPVVIAQILLISMQFVDTVMAGHVSAGDLAALGIATALFHPLLLLIIGILMAVTPMVAQLKGSQKDHRISKIVADALDLVGFQAGLVVQVVGEREDGTFVFGGKLYFSGCISSMVN